ncbi:MAG: hypothetical protein R2940_16720 [Syntrophotaleaceae bacterium]
MRHLEFTTTDIELAAALMVALNAKPSEIRPGKELVEFTFPKNEATESVITKFAAGSLFQEVRRFASNRSWLYRQVREVARTGKPWGGGHGR